MKILLSLFFVSLITSCESNAKYLNEDTPNEDLLQTLQNSYLNSTYDLSTFGGYKLNEHKEEIAKNLKIVDTFHIGGYGQTLVLYSYSIGSDIIRDSESFKKENGKWYRAFNYFSSYDDDPFKDGNGIRAKEILDKEEKWNKESEDSKVKIFGSPY